MKKIKLTNFPKILTFSLLLLGLILPIPLLIVSLNSTNHKFVLGNYQSYMSQDVMNELSSQYGLSYDYFETAEDVKRLIKKNTIDIGNTTSYELINLIQEDVVQKLDWSLFNIPGVSNATEALQLFTLPTQTILQTTWNGISYNLLDYGVPYFLQDLVFVYRGLRIDALQLNPTWEKVLDVIATDERFAPNHLPNLIALDDPRSIYSIPRSIQTIPNININPDTNASIDNLNNTYQILSNKLSSLGSKSIILNPDSNTVLNMVAIGQANGGIMFNGDAMYAALGGDDAVNIEEDDFHCVKPENNVVALDLMVLNKNLKSKKLVDSYDILKALCLNTDTDEQTIESNLTFTNFDFVNYTPPLKAIYDYITDPDTAYFEYDWQMNIIEINEVLTNQIETPIDNLTKSNFSFAWITFKSNLT